MITLKSIQILYKAEIARARHLVNSDLWHESPQNNIGLCDELTILGWAKKGGFIEVSKRFIGTNSVELLSNTIRHEISHLIVGRHNNHNKKFNNVADILGVKNNSTFDLSEIKNQIKFKYTVIAHLVNGSSFNVGGVHRKTKKYSDYKLSSINAMSVNNIKISYFEFLKNI